MQKIQKILVPVIIVIAISISVFLFFKPFFDHENLGEFATQILAAILGTIMTVSITAILLQAQSVSEENKEKSLGIFQHKLKIYSDFIELIWQIVEDSKITKREVAALVNGAARISLVAGKALSQGVHDFVRQCIELRKIHPENLNKDEMERYVQWFNESHDYHIESVQEIEKYFVNIGHVVWLMREDLGEDNTSDPDAALTSGNYYNEMIKKMVHN